MATILVVDDHAGMRAILERILVGDGPAVTVASDGREALRLIESTAFDLMITDLVMPDVEGTYVLRVLRRRPDRPRIIAISGGARGSAEHFLAVATRLGADATLAKPFTPEDLSAVVKQVLGRQTGSDDSVPGQA